LLFAYSRVDTRLNHRRFDTRNVKSWRPAPVKKKFWITADFRSPDTCDDPKSRESSARDSLRRVHGKHGRTRSQPRAILILRKVRMQIGFGARSPRQDNVRCVRFNDPRFSSDDQNVGADPKRDDVRLRISFFVVSDGRTAPRRPLLSAKRIVVVVQRRVWSSLSVSIAMRIGYRSADLTRKRR
jgi:hypothetical protein